LTALPATLLAIVLPAVVAVIVCAIVVFLLARQIRHQRAMQTQ
jgi:uncharacterized membrane-anchored protein YhcB (DUF1043 family)